MSVGRSFWAVTRLAQTCFLQDRSDRSPLAWLCPVSRSQGGRVALPRLLGCKRCRESDFSAFEVRRAWGR